MNTIVQSLSRLDELTKTAELRAEEIAISFSHTRPDNTKWYTAFEEYSLQYVKAGENLARGFKTPKAVVKAWMNSKSHKANILNPEFINVEIGYYINDNGKLHISQLFYTPMSLENDILN